MEMFVTPLPNKPQRSLSYNDLKRKRLQRSASHKKVNQQQQSATNRGRNLSQQKSFFKQHQKEDSTIDTKIKELKGEVFNFRRKASQKNFISLRQSMTDRPRRQKMVNSINEQKVQPVWNNVQETGQTKLLIRNLMNKNKSQRRLMRINQIRDKLKMEKQKSRSNEKPKIIADSKSPLKQKTVVKSDRNQVNSNEQYKQTIKEGHKKQIQNINLQKLLDELINCPQQSKNQLWNDELLNKQNSMRHSNLMEIQQISEIKQQENMDKFDESQNIVFQQTHNQGSFLKLLHDSKQVKGAVKNREIKRRSEIERLKRIFPLGFFAK